MLLYILSPEMIHFISLHGHVYVAGAQAAIESTADEHTSACVQRTLDANEQSIHCIYMHVFVCSSGNDHCWSQYDSAPE